MTGDQDFTGLFPSLLRASPLTVRTTRATHKFISGDVESARTSPGWRLSDDQRAGDPHEASSLRTGRTMATDLTIHARQSRMLDNCRLESCLPTTQPQRRHSA